MLPGETHASADRDFPVTLFNFAPGDTVHGMQWPHIEDELGVTRRLHAISTNWTISVLTNKATSSSGRLATHEIILLHKDLVAAEASRKAMGALGKILSLIHI